MKQKSSSSNLVTKVFLKDELINLGTRVDIKLDRLERRIDDNAQKYRDQILTKLDGVMGELQTIREDNMIGTHQTRELREEVESHEKRIKNLEKIQQAA